ncbi:hypothetical protein CR513_37255, partial [Mucuna pruriens]
MKLVSLGTIERYWLQNLALNIIFSYKSIYKTIIYFVRLCASKGMNSEDGRVLRCKDIDEESKIRIELD